MPAILPPNPQFVVLGAPQTTTVWGGSALILGANDGATMSETPNGSMIFGYQNKSPQNSAGTLALTSGGGAPEFLVAPALSLQPQILTRNWQANNLNVTNISPNTDTPIWIEAFAPSIGPKPTPLPIGEPIAVGQNEALQGATNPNWMQLQFRFSSSQFAVFGIIGGPPDPSGNNAYIVAVNSPSGDTGSGTGKTPPPGYYGTAGGNVYSFQFNWGSAVIFVAYFGSANVISKLAAVETPIITLLSL